MSDWIKTKAGLQMAETIIRKMPRIVVCLEEIALGLNYLRRLENNCKADSADAIIVKQYQSDKDDLLKLCDEMDIRHQENINLKFQIDEIKEQIKTLTKE